jgi:hypothetical protein
MGIIIGEFVFDGDGGAFVAWYIFSFLLLSSKTFANTSPQELTAHDFGTGEFIDRCIGRVFYGREHVIQG